MTDNTPAPMGAKVKPLVFRTAKISDKWERWTADAIFGSYEVLEYSKGGFGWNVSFYDEDLEAIQYQAKSIEAAKAAAQADYAARILSALEPAPEVAALVEAAASLRNDFKLYKFNNMGDLYRPDADKQFAQIDAALAALKGGGK